MTRIAEEEEERTVYTSDVAAIAAFERAKRQYGAYRWAGVHLGQGRFAIRARDARTHEAIGWLHEDPQP